MADSTVSISDVGLALILLDQERRNNIEQKKRLGARIRKLQLEMDELSLESLRCAERIQASEKAISRLSTSHEYKLLGF